MDVPLFPTPPAFGGAADAADAATSPVISDIYDDASSDVVTHVAQREPGRNREYQRERHAAAVTAAIHSKVRGARLLRGKRYRLGGASKNIVHPRGPITSGARRRHVTEFRLRMTERQRNDKVEEEEAQKNVDGDDDEEEDEDDDDDDDDDVVACADTFTVPTEAPPSWIMKSNVPPRKRVKSTKSVALQTEVRIPLRLRVLPSLREIVDENGTAPANSKSSILWRHLRFLGRLSLSQFGLVWLLNIWAIVGAAAFCATEGPREREQVVELKNMQRDLAVGLATELRQLRTEKEEDVEPLWSDKVRQYVAKHEQLLLAAVSSGYGETSDGGQLWTFPGCVLFAVSLLTTLGFGAPVPRTNAGRTVAIIFAAIGIPAHFLLIMNLGILLAVRLQKYAIGGTMNDKDTHRDSTTEVCHSSTPPVPKWVKVVPFVCIGGYYILGVLCFGIARSRPLAASVLFPLDFTAAGGLSTTRGYVRVLYAIYLEGAVVIAAVAVAVLRVSATQSLTNIGLKYGLLTEA